MANYKKPDYWQQKARKEGYPARSVYKLEEIDQKFKLFKTPLPFTRILDIGAAPGSWSLYVLRKYAAAGKTNLQAAVEKTNSKVDIDEKVPQAVDGKIRSQTVNAKNCILTAVDLSPLSREFDKGLFDNGNFFFIQGDINDTQTRESIFLRGPYSTIISDAAPSTTGSCTVDAASSLELVETVLDYAHNTLAPGGNLALKIFQSGGSSVLLKKMKPLFQTVKSFKPQACRGESMEIYYIGMIFLTEKK